MSAYDHRVRSITKTLVLAFAADDNQIVSSSFELNGMLARVVFVVPNLDSTNTADVTIKDSDGYTVYTKATVAKSTTSNEEKTTRVSGMHTITIDTSGAQTANRTFVVKMLVD
jgi:hypothetical protein